MKESDLSDHTGCCQICARRIKIPHGRIAHHGYLRPGWGEQTTSCPGARQLPFEADCSVLEKYVREASESLAAISANIARYERDRLPVPNPMYEVWLRKCLHGIRKDPEPPMTFRPDTEIYDVALRRFLVQHQGDIARRQQEISRQRGRLDEWHAQRVSLADDTIRQQAPGLA